jgi:hypothetical protein
MSWARVVGSGHTRAEESRTEVTGGVSLFLTELAEKPPHCAGSWVWGNGSISKLVVVKPSAQRLCSDLVWCGQGLTQDHGSMTLPHTRMLGSWNHSRKPQMFLLHSNLHLSLLCVFSFF